MSVPAGFASALAPPIFRFRPARWTPRHARSHPEGHGGMALARTDRSDFPAGSGDGALVITDRNLPPGAQGSARPASRDRSTPPVATPIAGPHGTHR